MKDGFTQIEINGVKFEVDLRTARKVETLSVGCRIKVLKKGYSDTYEVYAGTIVGFDNFQALPTISFAYIDQSYNGGLKFGSFNEKSKDFEIVADEDQRGLELNKAYVLEMMDREIEKKEAEAKVARRQREFFIERFGAFFEEKKPANVE